MVYVTHFDEIKPNPRYNQPYYWLGAISIPMADIHGIEAKVNALAKRYFGSEELTTATEFHSIDIYFRTGNFKAEADVRKRLQVFKELFEIFDGADRMKRHGRGTLRSSHPQNAGDVSQPARRARGFADMSGSPCAEFGN